VSVSVVSIFVADKYFVILEQDITGDCKICEYFGWLITKLLWFNMSEQLSVRVVSNLCG
jgi:hypothetical protein